MWEYTTPSHGLPIGAFFRGEAARNAYRRNEDYSIKKGNSTVVLVKTGTKGSVRSVDVLEIVRPSDLGDLAGLGLTMADGRRLLAQV